MGLQRFPYKKFTGINTSDRPFDIPSSCSPDCYNVIPRNYQTLEGIRTRESSRIYIQAVGGTFITGLGPLDGAIWWPDKNLGVMNSDGDIFKAPGLGGAISSIFNDPTITQEWMFAIGPNSVNVDTLWAMPLQRQASTPSVPQKWDGAAAGTSAWGGGVPSVALPNGVQQDRSGGIVWWRNRLIVWNAAGFPNRLFYSDKGNPEAPTAANYGNNFQDFPDSDDDAGLTMCVPHQESLLVFRERGVWQVYDPSTFANKRLVVGIGCGFRYQAISHSNGRCYFISNTNDQVYSISLRGDLVMESYPIRFSLSQRGWDPKDQLLVTPKGAVVYKQAEGDVWEMIPAKPGEGAWFRHQFPGSGIQNNFWFNGVDFGKDHMAVMGNAGASGLTIYRYFGSSEDPFFSGNDSTGAAGASSTKTPAPYWQSSWRPFLSEEPVERVRRVHLIGAGVLKLRMYAESSPRLNPSAKFVSPALSLAVSDFGAGRDYTLSRPETRGRYHAFRITAEPSESFEVDELEFVFRGGKEHIQQ